MFQQDGAPAHREHNTVAFMEREREKKITRQMRRRLGTCVRVRGAHFEHEF